MKKYIYIYLISLLTVFGVSSCDFGDVNIDPNNPTDVPLNLILPSAEAQTAFNIGALGGRMPGLIMQHFEGLEAQQAGYSNYVINEQTFSNLWDFGLYGGSMKDCAVIIEKAQAEGNPYYEGIAKVVMAHSLGLATNFFGDVPYSEAFQGEENTKPIFDTQETIFATIQRLLDEAITALGQPDYTDPAPPGSDDLIYGGDVTKWIATARALKARFLLQLSRQGTFNANDVLTNVSGAFTSAADEPGFPFESTLNQANPYRKFSNDRSNTMGVGNSFVATLAARNDPRAPFIFSDVQTYDGPDAYWAQGETPLPLISYEEVKFIEAEAIVRSGGSDADAVAAMVAGVTANMTKLGVTEQADIDAYVASRVNFTGLTTAEQKIERIIEEKYVSMYAQGETEAWSDYRRTGYPNLTPSADGDNGLNPGGEIPQRFIYPDSERTTNSVNLEAAKSRQGGDLMNVRLWAFQ